ncbi:MAG: DUF2283 domain-containing protein [Chloroflexota bacterium]|nr:DUF2283 domain-containing protein [Chloroflexota bacterium]
MDLTIQTDAENDIVYIALSRRALTKGAAARSPRVDGDIAMDLDAAGRLLGIELMNASRRLGASASTLPARRARRRKGGRRARRRPPPELRARLRGPPGLPRAGRPARHRPPLAPLAGRAVRGRAREAHPAARHCA